MLETLGLDPAVEAVYRASLEHPGAGLRELAATAALPEAKIRFCLERLVELELLQPSREHPGLLRPVSPEVGLDLLLRRQEAALLRRQEELARSKESVARAIAEYTARRSETEPGGAETLRGMDAVQNRLERLAKDLTGECLAIMPGGAQSAASLRASRPLDEAALGRGIRLLTVYQNCVRNDPATLAYARWMNGLGGEVRTAPVLPPRLLVFDRRTALVPVDPADSRQGALCTTAPGLVASLVALFEQTWEVAVPLGADTRSDTCRADDALTPDEKELLKLLASGMTDEAAGKRLGVSLRTVRRQMASIMERLDAGSRFEAGLKAARSGWL